MKSVSFDVEKIQTAILEVEQNFNKIDEWFIARERFNFYLTHDFHPYFAAFPPELVSRLLKQYSKEDDTFLDPFMGGGSSIVEGFMLKRKTIGIDISPLSKFISEVKTRPINIDNNKINSILSNISNDIFAHKFHSYSNLKYQIPPITNIDSWFTKESKLDLSIILHHIKEVDDKSLRDFLLLAFSSIVRKVSNAKNAQQHLCTKKEKRIPDAYPLFESKVRLMTSQMKDYLKKLDNLNSYKFPELFVYDIRKMDEIVRSESVDIIITSPPYGTGSRYTEVNRFNFEWLELPKPRKTETLETSSDFKHELKKAIFQMYKVLKGGKYCFFVYGDPSTEDSLTRIAINDAKCAGFEYEGLISCPIEKTITNHHERYRRFIPKDFILIFKKPLLTSY